MVTSFKIPAGYLNPVFHLNCRTSIHHFALFDIDLYDICSITIDDEHNVDESFAGEGSV